jgi:hypothetical protein
MIQEALVVVLVAAFALLQALILFVLRDIKERVVRLENHAMGGPRGSSFGLKPNVDFFR